MEHKPVESSNIASIAHNGDTLEVRFKCGPCNSTGKVMMEALIKAENCPKCGGKGFNAYKYQGVSPEIHARVMTGEPREKDGPASVGSAFNRLVKANPNYVCTKV